MDVNEFWKFICIHLEDLRETESETNRKKSEGERKSSVVVDWSSERGQAQKNRYLDLLQELKAQA